MGIKPWIILICLMMLATGLQSQIPSDSFYIQKFSLPQRQAGKGKYCLIQLKGTASQECKNSLTTHAIRQFSATLFIADTAIMQTPICKNNPLVKILPVNDNWKLSPQAEKMILDLKDNQQLSNFQMLYTSAGFPDENVLKNGRIPKQNITIFADRKIISVACTLPQLQQFFLSRQEIVFIDLALHPVEELGTPGFDLTANALNIVHSRYPFINGQGQHVSIKEDYYDTADIDIKGRYDTSPLASPDITNHANFMATIIAGAGNSANYALGAANQAMVSSSSFKEVLPDADSAYLQNHITVQNHSYGTLPDNSYGMAAQAFDKSANNNPNLLHVFSSGNSGDKTSTSGNYNGVAAYANLTGNFKMAKNIITVGAVDSFGNVVPLSSKGPAYDGRIKPDIVAFQKNGTSEAAALVSGTVLLLQQYYKVLHKDSSLSSSLAKAIVINTANDVGTPGPDYTSGFGNLDASKAMDLLRDGHFLKGEVGQGQENIFSLAVPKGISLLKITLVWNDTAATPQAPKALVNDVDLEVADPSANVTWQPWVLNSFANANSLGLPAIRKKDSLNNVEQVTIDNPVEGNYEVRIKGYNLPAGKQKYDVAYSFDRIASFHWNAPQKTDLAVANAPLLLRWQTSFNATGKIEYTAGNSNVWQSISGDVQLQKDTFYWQVPDTISTAVVRMKIGSNYFYTDTFIITTLLKPSTGFICGDSVLTYWNKLKNVNRYQLYQLGSKYMEPFLVVADTSVVLAKSDLKGIYITVAPFVNAGIVGTKSYALNYTLQGTGCYIDAFYITANDSVAALNLSLGTLVNISSIQIEKLGVNSYLPVANITSPNQLQYVFLYAPLTPGITYFRAKITLKNGQVIYSKPEAAFYTAPGNYLLLPNPATRGSSITLLTSITNGATILLKDITGSTVLQQRIISSPQQISTATLQTGQYFYFIYKNNLKVGAGKILVL